MRALEVENNLNLKAVQLTKSGLRVFGFCPAGSTSVAYLRTCLSEHTERSQKWNFL